MNNKKTLFIFLVVFLVSCSCDKQGNDDLISVDFEGAMEFIETDNPEEVIEEDWSIYNSIYIINLEHVIAENRSISDVFLIETTT